MVVLVGLSVLGRKEWFCETRNVYMEMRLTLMNGQRNQRGEQGVFVPFWPLNLLCLETW